MAAGKLRRAYPALSKSHRRAADFALHSPLEAAALGIEDFARAAGISVATANRFVRAVGYPGYAAFRNELLAGLKAALAPVDKLEAARRDGKGVAESFAESLAGAAQNVERARSTVTAEAAARAIEALTHARRIVTLGFGLSAHVAAYLSDGLEAFIPNSQALPAIGGAEQATRRLAKLGAGDVVVAVSFPRYSRSAIDLAAAARAQGATLIVLTDGPQSPLAALADVALFAPVESKVLPASMAAAFALAESLIAAVATKKPEGLAAFEALTKRILPYLQMP